jgi:hypothetical protein
MVVAPTQPSRDHRRASLGQFGNGRFMFAVGCRMDCLHVMQTEFPGERKFPLGELRAKMFA